MFVSCRSLNLKRNSSSWSRPVAYSTGVAKSWGAQRRKRVNVPRLRERDYVNFVSRAFEQTIGGEIPTRGSKKKKKIKSWADRFRFCGWTKRERERRDRKDREIVKSKIINCLPEFRWLIPAVKYSRARTIRWNEEGKIKKEKIKEREREGGMKKWTRMQRFNGWFFHDPEK